MTAYAAFIVCEYGLWIAMLVYAYAEGGAGTAGVVAVAQLVPSVIVALLVAPLAERTSPVSVLRGGFAVVGVAAAATAALLLTGSAPLLVYLGAMATSGSMSTIRPAQSALIPALATEVEELMATNVLIGWVENLGILVAGLAAGLALTLGGPGHAYAGAAVLLAAAFLLVAPLRAIALGRREAPAEADAASGSELGQLWRDKPARLLVSLLGAEFVVIGALDLLFVVMAVDVLDAGEEWAGYLNTAYGVGALVLGALAALLVGRRLGPVIVATALVLGAAMAVTAVVDLVAVVVLLSVVGGMKALFDVGVRVLLQRSVPPHRIARIFGFAEGMSMFGLGVGSIIVPVLVSLGGPELAVYGAAALLPVVVLLRIGVLFRIDEHARVPVVEISLLRQIPIFHVLPGETLEGLAQQLERVAFEPGEVLVRQGDVGDFYYAIAQGDVDVLQDGAHIRTLSRADGLGEIALLRDDRRTATARAATPVTAFRLDRDAFLGAVTGHHPTLESAHAVVREHEVRDASRDQPPSS